MAESIASKDSVEAETAAQDSLTQSNHNGSQPIHKKLHGRAFYESIGSPKLILAPMVDQSEFAWRLLTRSFMSAEDNKRLLAYTPMYHARLFAESEKYYHQCVQPTRHKCNQILKDGKAAPSTPQDPITDSYLDGNPSLDRPLTVQFCANDPEYLLAAAKRAAPFCDAVDLNLGCPQGIARKGHYGAFLQEDWDLIHRLINKLHIELPIPVTAKIRILETPEKTLAYAKMVLAAGASILTVHGRRREQKGHLTGIADWTMIRHLRDNLPPETVIFANGNILQHDDIQKCLDATGADGVMSAEGNLHDPSIFAAPPSVGAENREYWRGADGKGGYRMDAVIRRYLDIIYKHVLHQEPPTRKPLFILGDTYSPLSQPKIDAEEENGEEEEPARKKRKKNRGPNAVFQPQNLLSIQAHLFSILRPLITVKTEIRDLLGRTRAGDMPGFEKVLAMVENVTKEAIIEQANATTVPPNSASLAANEDPDISAKSDQDAANNTQPISSTTAEPDDAKTRCARPWWICQSFLRVLPEEAYANGSLQLSKKKQKELALKQETQSQTTPVLTEEAQDSIVQGDESVKAAVAG